MEPEQDIDARGLWREQVEQARAMTPAERFRTGIELTAFGFTLMATCIRAEAPGADDAFVARRIRERIAIVRRLEART